MTARWTSPSHRQVIRSVSTGLAIRLIFRLLPSTHLQPFLDRLPPRVLERLRLSVDSRFRRPPLPRARTRLELIADALRHRASIAVSLHLEGRLWNPRPGLPIHTLHLQAAMIDPGREARVAKRLVAHPCPALPRELQLLDQGAQSMLRRAASFSSSTVFAPRPSIPAWRVVASRCAWKLRASLPGKSRGACTVRSRANPYRSVSSRENPTASLNLSAGESSMGK